ncbi:hypothetical protein [Candidatus Nitrospira bockiana]
MQTTFEGSGHHQHVAIPLEHEPIDLVGDLGGRQREVVASRGDQAAFHVMKDEAPDDERHERHRDDEDR